MGICESTPNPPLPDNLNISNYNELLRNLKNILYMTEIDMGKILFTYTQAIIYMKNL
jgi:hypothetical protein